MSWVWLDAHSNQAADSETIAFTAAAEPLYSTCTSFDSVDNPSWCKRNAIRNNSVTFSLTPSHAFARVLTQSNNHRRRVNARDGLKNLAVLGFNSVWTEILNRGRSRSNTGVEVRTSWKADRRSTTVDDFWDRPPHSHAVNGRLRRMKPSTAFESVRKRQWEHYTVCIYMRSNVDWQPTECDWLWWIYTLCAVVVERCYKATVDLWFSQQNVV